MCLLTLDYDFSAGCSGGVGGIKNIAMLNFGSRKGTGSTFTQAGGIVTAFTPATGAAFVRYKLDSEMGSFTDAGKQNSENGSVSYEASIEFSIKGLSVAIKDEINRMAKQPLTMVVQTNENVYWLVGYEEPMRLVTFDAMTGQKFEDMRGHKMTFNGKSPVYAYQLDVNIGAGIFA